MRDTGIILMVFGKCARLNRKTRFQRKSTKLRFKL